MRDLPELEITGVPGSFFDRFADFRLSRFTKARQLGDSPGFACLQQLLNRADLKFFVKRFDLLRAETRNRE